MGVDFYVSELNGYLKALQTISGKGFRFFVRSYCCNEGVDDFVYNNVRDWFEGSSSYSLSEIVYEEVFECVEFMVFSGFNRRFSELNVRELDFWGRMIREDINEYYGLMSNSSTDGSEVFHPLVEGPVFVVDFAGISRGRIFLFFVLIGDFYVVTCFFKK
ncbi:hypothetical protein [Marinobacter xestospongiae]|uniref:Uncharacterized protein n=1 Tax=Marinobacter xestospongiae TaxID=994319 RepID=A0ABU3VW46_9GAMM|nr:hypothetical protein [Marinobacter xestospongiae]MDV2078510.1 hypothetical protein [Marinobacter xestospongiae]